jgi:hypothetical protein
VTDVGAKIWGISRRLVMQNRWLYLFLILWPLLIASVFLISRSSSSEDDVAATLHEECIYGLALVAFTGSVQLGNEERSRRIVGVLSRAVSRRQYLLALFWACWIPLALYALSILLSSVLLDAYTNDLARTVFDLTLLGIWTATVSLFFAVFLPSVFATIATLATVSVTAVVGRVWPAFGMGALLSALTGMGEAPVGGGRLVAWLTTMLGAAVFFLGAAFLFEFRDLRLKQD